MASCWCCQALSSTTVQSRRPRPPPAPRSPSRASPSTYKSAAAHHQQIVSWLNDGNLSQALRVLHRMPHPTTNDFNRVLTAYAQQGRVTEAEALVQQMVDRCKAEQTNNKNNKYCPCQPDRHSYYQLLDALLLQSSSSGRHQHDNAAKRGHEILKVVVHNFGSASTVAYNKVLKLWKQQEQQQQQTTKNSNHPTTTMAVQQSESLLQNMIRLGIADCISYTTFIAILAAAGDAERAHQVAQQMADCNTNNIQPNTQTWNTVLHAYVRCGELERAEGVLKQMEAATSTQQQQQQQPDSVTFSTLLDGWAKSGRPDAVTQMQDLLHRMTTAGVVPRFWTYVTLVHAHARQGDAARAEALVRDMYEQSQSSSSSSSSQNNNGVKPNTQLVTAVLDAWQKSRRPDGAERAQALLDWMMDVQDRDLAPNEYSFSCEYDSD